jgi:hypothetical protein
MPSPAILPTLRERLSRQSGGRAIFTDSMDELRRTFDELIDELSSQYVLGYQPGNATRDDSWRQITVDVDAQRHVRARQSYRPMR